MQLTRGNKYMMRLRLLKNNGVLGGGLVDMYAKYGIVSKVRQVLDELPSLNVVSWSGLIEDMHKRSCYTST